MRIFYVIYDKLNAHIIWICNEVPVTYLIGTGVIFNKHGYGAHFLGSVRPI
jgi:hypothetical protein